MTGTRGHRAVLVTASVGLADREAKKKAVSSEGKKR
jgi:hypothetical protein